MVAPDCVLHDELTLMWGEFKVTSDELEMTVCGVCDHEDVTQRPKAGP